MQPPQWPAKRAEGGPSLASAWQFALFSLPSLSCSSRGGLIYGYCRNTPANLCWYSQNRVDTVKLRHCLVGMLSSCKPCPAALEMGSRHRTKALSPFCQPCQPHPFPISQGHPSQQPWVLAPADGRDSLGLAGRQGVGGLGAVGRLKTKRHWSPLCWGLGPLADFPSLWTMSSFRRPPCVASSSEKTVTSWPSPGMSAPGKRH